MGHIDNMSVSNLNASKLGVDQDLVEFEAVGGFSKTKLDCGAPLPAITASTGAAAALTADTTTNCWTWADGNYVYASAEQAQTLCGPIAAATGIDVQGDATDDDGREIRSKMSTVKGRLNKDHYIVGTSPAFYAKCKFSIADVSGSDDIRFGFAKDEAFNDAPDDLDELAAFKINAGDVKTSTILNNAATVVTDLDVTNWADGETHTLEVRVSAAGAVTFYYDGALQSSPSFSFDSGEQVVMYWWQINSSDLHGALIWEEMEWGLQ